MNLLVAAGQQLSFLNVFCFFRHLACVIAGLDENHWKIRQCGQRQWSHCRIFRWVSADVTAERACCICRHLQLHGTGLICKTYQNRSFFFKHGMSLVWITKVISCCACCIQYSQTMIMTVNVIGLNHYSDFLLCPLLSQKRQCTAVFLQKSCWPARHQLKYVCWAASSQTRSQSNQTL